MTQLIEELPRFCLSKCVWFALGYVFKCLHLYSSLLFLSLLIMYIHVYTRGVLEFCAYGHCMSIMLGICVSYTFTIMIYDFD